MNPVQSRLQAALAGRYAIEHELGRGGMAVVYLGRDLRLERPVAIKVFETGAGFGASGSERFLREIRVAAQLQHPNILPVFESGEAEGLIYYVMPYVGGASLRERLEREGQLPVADVVRIGREVAEALDHAHRAGIVHRDIKPENILLADGVAVVADFGIARALEGAAAGGPQLTETQAAIGTPKYMSPEQARAEPVDGRSDLYSLGCVLYELLTGRTPFEAPTGQAVMLRHTTDPVAPIRVQRQDVPEAIEAVVVKALAKQPADRWQTGSEVASAFADAERRTGGWPSGRVVRLGIAVSGVAVLGALGWLVRGSASARADDTHLPSVAVLPFVVIGDTGQSYLAAGLTEAIITALIKVEGLRVPSFGSVATSSNEDPREIGRRLAVATVLTGSIRVAGPAIRVEPRLVRVSDGLNAWAESYDGQVQDVFAMQDSIAGHIVEALRPVLAPAQRAAIARGVRTSDPEALALYLRGRRATLELTRPGVERGIRLLEEALARDSSYADAWVALADAYNAVAQVGSMSAAEAASRMRTAIERGIELDSLNGFAFALRANLRALNDWDWSGALRDLRRARRLSPGSAEVEVLYAALLNLFGEPDSSLAHMRRAVSLDPVNPFMWANLGIRFGYLEWHDSAVVAATRAIALDSTNWLAHGVLATALHRSGRTELAERSVSTVMTIAGDSVPLVLALTARDHARHAPRMLELLTDLSRRQHVPAIYLAMARHAAGDLPGSLDAVEQSARDHELDLPWFLEGLDRLHDDPRYEAVRRHVFGPRGLSLPSER